MEASRFRRRMHALGAETAGEAADILQLDLSSVSRMWNGTRQVSPQTERIIALTEAGQPARMTTDMRRIILTNFRGTVSEPTPRSRFEAGKEWGPVFNEMRKRGLIDMDNALTELGVRCLLWLRATTP